MHWAEGMKQCDNCGKHIPISSIDVHMAFCARNFVHCPVCKAIVKRFVHAFLC